MNCSWSKCPSKKVSHRIRGKNYCFFHFIKLRKLEQKAYFRKSKLPFPSGKSGEYLKLPSFFKRVKDPLKYLLPKKLKYKFDFRFDAKHKSGYKLEPKRTLTPEQEIEAERIYQDFFTPEHRFKVDPGNSQLFRVS